MNLLECSLNILTFCQLHSRKRKKDDGGQFVQKQPRFYQENEFNSLSEKLQNYCQDLSEQAILNPSYLRKYIAYVKKLSKEAAEVIKEFYLQLRESHFNTTSIPITNRQLESLIRLSQARAKVECRDVVTQKDALEVVELMQESLFDSLEDLSYNGMGNNGGGVYGGQGQQQRGNQKNFNMNSVGNLSVQKQTKYFLDKLAGEAALRENPQFSYNDLATVAKSIGMNVGDFSEFIQKLNHQSQLIFKGNRIYELSNSKRMI